MVSMKHSVHLKTFSKPKKTNIFPIMNFMIIIIKCIVYIITSPTSYDTIVRPAK